MTVAHNGNTHLKIFNGFFRLSVLKFNGGVNVIIEPL